MDLALAGSFLGLLGFLRFLDDLPAQRRGRHAVIRYEARLVMPRQHLIDQGLDGGQLVHLVGGDQGDRLATGSGTAGTTDAMHVILGDGGQVEVDHLRQVVDVQSARRHVGRHQHLHLASLEALQRAQTRGLRLVAVDRVAGDALRLQLVHQLIDALARLDEHQHLTPAPLRQQMQEQLALALLVHRHQPLLDRLRRRIARADLDRQRVAQQLAGHLPDRLGEGRGKQQGLALSRQSGEQRIQLFSETEVEHAVRLVEHQRLQLGETDGVLPVEVEQAPRGGHQHIDALAQRHHLRIDAHAAVHRVGAQRQVLPVHAKALVNLLGQFTGRHQYQRAHRIARHLGAFHGQALQ